MNWVSIDFGTSYSSATVLVDNNPVKVHPIGGLYNMYGFPTVAYVDHSGHIKVCDEALNWRNQHPERFVKDFKLNIHEDKIEYLGVTYRDIIKEILKYIKKSAEYTIGDKEIRGAVITIPATYSENDPRKEIMESSAKDAGFTEIEFVREAEAAAIYYHSIQKDSPGTITLIYDLGGGTFDPALVEHLSEGYHLLGYTSGKECGGKYFEAQLYKEFKKTYNLEYSDDENIRNQQIDGIASLCKDIKEKLSIKPEVSFPVPLMNVEIGITRPKFESLIKPLVEKTFQECSALISSAQKQWKDIDRILLIGGSCAIPCIRKFFREYLKGQNRADIPIIFNVSDEGVFIDTLFAVSIGGLLSHYSLPIYEDDNEDDWHRMAIAFMQGDGVERNWVKAAFCFEKDYELKRSQDSYDKMVQIYQCLVDNLYVEKGELGFHPIVNTFGQDSIEALVDILIFLQSDMETRGHEAFVSDIFKLSYWFPITKSVLKVDDFEK